VNTRVKGEFHCREMFGSIFLTFVTEKTKVLLHFLVFVVNFAVTLRMVGSSETGLNTKMLVESTHKAGHNQRRLSLGFCKGRRHPNSEDWQHPRLLSWTYTVMQRNYPRGQPKQLA
jgi:hypothetical protein